jgi:hypothetical protein
MRTVVYVKKICYFRTVNRKIEDIDIYGDEKIASGRSGQQQAD